MRLKNIKAPTHAFALAALLLTLAVCTMLFISAKKRLNSLGDSLAKSAAYCTRLESELEELKNSYNALKNDYAALEQTKAERKNAKTVYLTFDDGPSDNTEEILDILARYNIKATFFTVGRTGGRAASLYRRMISEGHAVGNHTFSHEYSVIYSSSDAFWEEYRRNDRLFFSATGRHFEIMRFPGGSNNTVSRHYCKDIMSTLTSQARDAGIAYFDWNVSSRDAEKAVQDKSVITESVLSGVKSKKVSIVLMHDSNIKTTTVAALPEIIESLKKQGCVFKTLSKATEPVRFS